MVASKHRHAGIYIPCANDICELLVNQLCQVMPGDKTSARKLAREFESDVGGLKGEKKVSALQAGGDQLVHAALLFLAVVTFERSLERQRHHRRGGFFFLDRLGLSRLW